MRLSRLAVIAQNAESTEGAYVWDVYRIEDGVDPFLIDTYIPDLTEVIFSNEYESKDGQLILINPSTATITTGTTEIIVNKYVRLPNYRNDQLSYCEGYDGYKNNMHRYYGVILEYMAMRGEPTGETVSSNDAEAYPHDGAQGDYWYVLRE